MSDSCLRVGVLKPDALRTGDFITPETLILNEIKNYEKCKSKKNIVNHCEFINGMIFMASRMGLLENPKALYLSKLNEETKQNSGLRKERI